MKTSHKNYRDWLLDEFAARSSRNRLYSLRAFARDLDLRPSHLSAVLKGKLGLSAKSATRIAEVLGLSPSETSYFVTLVEAAHSRSSVRRQSAHKKLSQIKVSTEYQILEDHVFEVISDWLHYAILELAQTDNFVPRLSWIEERLGVSRVEVDSAVRRLKTVGLLTIKNGKWMVHEKFPATRSEVPSTAIKKFHSQIIQKANEALYMQPVAQRDFSTMTFSINPEDLPEIKEELRAFRRELEKKYKLRANKREVYSLSIQFFALTQPRKSQKFSSRRKVAHA